MTDTSERIFSLLKQKGIEQKEFAKMLGTTDKTVSAWKTGRSMSYTKNLPKIAEVLGTTVEYLLSGKKKAPATVAGDGPDPELWELIKRIPEDRMPEVERYLRFQAEQKEKP